MFPEAGKVIVIILISRIWHLIPDSPSKDLIGKLFVLETLSEIIRTDRLSSVGLRFFCQASAMMYLMRASSPLAVLPVFLGSNIRPVYPFSVSHRYHC